MQSRRERSRESIQTSGRLGRVTRFEYVNRNGEIVNPKTGKPYARPGANNVAAKENSTKRNRPLPIKKAGAIFGGLDPIPTDPSIDPPPRACFNCWQPGHSRRKCPHPVNPRTCNNCGRRDVNVSTCPRCKYAYQRYLSMVEAKDRGEEVEPNDIEQLFPNSSDEDADNPCYDMMQQLINMQKQRGSHFMFMGQRSEPYDRQMHLEQQLNRENNDLYPGQQVEPIHPGREQAGDWEREIMLDNGEQEREAIYNNREREQEIIYCNREREIEYDRLREVGYNRERELAYNNREREQEIVYNDREQERQQDRFYPESLLQERSARPVSPIVNRQESPAQLAARYSEAVPTTLDSKSSTDPVQDILLLAKTIAHLSPETQDLIMRQVIAERKEQARQRALQERNDDVWP